MGRFLALALLRNLPIAGPYPVCRRAGTQSAKRMCALTAEWLQSVMICGQSDAQALEPGQLRREGADTAESLCLGGCGGYMRGRAWGGGLVEELRERFWCGLGLFGRVCGVDEVMPSLDVDFWEGDGVFCAAELR